ncbi:MAG TPA: DUF2066 domain-containing protein [Stellaceae bacterium]|nr:DUF2066 domain-containing protein [Stellaceae bacterium]
MTQGVISGGLKLLCALLALALLAHPATAAESAGLHGSAPPPSEHFVPPAGVGPSYQATAIVTGTDMRQRPWGLAYCLEEVLVKVSGDPRLKHDPRVEELGKEADRFVAAFHYVDMMAGIPYHDDQGTSDRPHALTVWFDPKKIDAALARFGDKPWRGERPVVVPALLVRGPKPPPYLLTAQTPRGAEQRDAFANAASGYGLKMRVPTAAEFEAWGIGPDHVALPAGKTPPGEAVVVGTLTWSESLPGWIGKWRMRWHGAAHEWGISGVNYDAAFRDIVRGVELVASGSGAPGN